MQDKSKNIDEQKAKKRASVKQQQAKVIRLKVSLRALRGVSSGQLPKNNEIFL